MNLQEIEDEPVDALTKGMPGYVAPLRLSEIGEMGWNVAAEDLPLPLLTLNWPALTNNIAVMQHYCDSNRVRLAPHGKTTMAPQIFKLQLDAGAWAISAATVQQLHVYRRFGVPRVLVANQIVGAPNLRYVCQELEGDPGFELISFVDSVTAVEVLKQAAQLHRLARPLQVLLEVGYINGRTGVRDVDTAERVWQATQKAAPYVQLVGVAAFEGLLPTRRHESGAEQVGFSPRDASTRQMQEYFVSCSQVVERLLALGALPDQFLLTAGGSAAFDLVVEWFAERWATVAQLVLRSGCYVTHDHGLYAAVSPLRKGSGRTGGHLLPALELWGYVQSRPEPDLALLTLGKRDAPYDYGLPAPIAYIPPGSRERVQLADCRVVALNDQHAYLRLPPDLPIAVGGRVICGISHPCTAFDKWRVISTVDDDDNVVGAIRTFF